MQSPIEQFEIHSLSSTLFTLGGQPVSFTNSTLYMVLAVLLASALMILPTRKRDLVPTRWQMVAELIYNLVADIVESGAGPKGKPFMPFIFTIFIFVMFCNLLGMIPHALTVTSHVIVNFAIAAVLFVIIIFTGFARHGLRFLKIFVPSGVPLALLPFMVVIEFISFWVRPFSLSIRLFGNMLAGHILLKVFAGMTAGLVAAGWVAAVGVLPLGLNIAITGFEFFVALLQAYVFSILSSVYLRDALEMH
jgi:F-type H+-transporting ATPase subunit a